MEKNVVFASGSCRIVTCIGDGRGVITPLHSHFFGAWLFHGCNFLTKLHTIDQHIQFFKWIKGDLILDDKHLPHFITRLSIQFKKYEGDDPLTSLAEIRKKFDSVNMFVIEICSLKNYVFEDVHHQMEMLGDYPYKISNTTQLELEAKVIELQEYLGKPIIWVGHFRPQIYHSGGPIDSREIIHTVLSKQKYYIDPSETLKMYSLKDVTFDPVHWSEYGHSKWFETIYRTILSI